MSVAAGQTEGDTPRVRRTATSSSVAGGGYAQPETGEEVEPDTGAGSQYLAARNGGKCRQRTVTSLWRRRETIRHLVNIPKMRLCGDRRGYVSE